MSDTGPLVYVVDDDPSAREGVARLIRSAGLMTKTFASGEEFLAAARPTIPSCLVLDVNLPGLSGLDVQKELIKSGAQIPVIFLTGHGDIPMTVSAVKAGAVDFLTKPFDDEALLAAIRQTLTFDLKEETRGEMSQVGNHVAMAAENALAYGRLQDQRLYLG
jgi:FixJ family two-component response regulator